ncbi:probable E3 ubiquitin-protein ligase HERC6 isoform X2 [Xenopus laevis]|uniref:Probable E3 ubiquitin-protein ligase HERC6 isoform X2 n=1 Tax=Xenopus laevis TaxID=8355 RepID=A0A8J0TWX4_XENLA|nr:probable E3 ubiquitin-protein ligase HERC6 isoform X2 [Xenopus laevis]
MYCWGDNCFGQLAVLEEEKEVVHFKENDYFQKKESVQKVSIGEKHSLYLLKDGTLLSCGQNPYGQLGRKGNNSRIEQISSLEAQTVVDVSCGTNHSVAMCDEGNIYSWGDGSEGQLGTGKFSSKNFTPKRITGLLNRKIIQISCGNFHSVALAEDGRVFSWGQNKCGQLGLGSQIINQATPQLVKSLKGIPLVQVTAGGSQTFALSMSGTVFAWGRNNAGQLGFKNDAKKGTFKPYAVDSLRDLGVAYISCGEEHTAVLSKDGIVYTFGDDTYGQLGQQSGNQTSVPQKIEEYSRQVSQVACGRYHTLLYVFTCNRIVSFGKGSQRQQGNAESSDQAEASQLPSAFDISSLVPANDLKDVNVKWIFAGNNVGFAVSFSQQETTERILLSDTFKPILRLDIPIVKKWMKAHTGSEEYYIAKREICRMFSSSASVTAGFINHRSSTTSSVSSIVDLVAASNVFTELNKDRRISDIICSSIRNDLIPELESLPLHFEAFAVFLLLPECPLLHDPSICLSLTVPLAKAINNMGESSLKILGTLWSCLQATSMTKQIQLLKTAVMLSIKGIQAEPGTKDLLQMLKKLYKANLKSNCIVPINTFCMNELCPLIWLPSDVNNWRLWQSQPEPDEKAFPAIYCRFPFVFNFPTKVQVLDFDSMQKRNTVILQAQKQLVQNRLQGRSDLPDIPFLHLVLRLDHLVEDALHKLSIVEDPNLKKDLLVEFQGESTRDPVTVKKEFFLVLLESMVNPDYGMFSCSDPLLPRWFPSTPLVEKKKYFYFGVICGLAVYNQTVIYLPFPLALFKKLLDKKATLEDLKEIQPTMGRGMQDLLDADSAESMELYFCFSWENKSTDLIPNGGSVQVNNLNKKEYVSKCIDYIFNTSVTESFEEFKRGFYKVCDKDIISFFQPDELRTVVAGTANYDWNTFEKTTIYLGKYRLDHPTIKMFWKVFHALSLEKKKGFLMFLTGNDKLPVFTSDNVGMKISRFGVPDETHLPEAQTCFHMLFLPEYSNINTLKQKLLLAIAHNTGYEKI